MCHERGNRQQAIDVPPCRLMRIGVPREVGGGRRVALTPDVVGRLADEGHAVLVELGAGVAADQPDESYRSRGARIVDGEEVWDADFVATVGPPAPPFRLRPGAALLGMLRPFDNPAIMDDLATTGGTVFAFEAVPRISRAQVVDALSSQATAAGYRAALEAAAACHRFFPMLTTAAGTVPPAKVLVLGAGVAGLQAIATTRRLGAVVSAFDVRAAAAEQVRSLGASFIEVEAAPQDAGTAGGYAREMEEEDQRRVLEGLAPHVAASDAVIATAAIPGRPAPLLITEEMVAAMHAGSVIVDVAAPTGGNCALTRPGETVVHGGVVVVGATDLEDRVSADASRMYARNVAAFLRLITKDGDLAIDLGDEVVSGACIAREGKVVHPSLTGRS